MNLTKLLASGFDFFTVLEFLYSSRKISTSESVSDVWFKCSFPALPSKWNTSEKFGSDMAQYVQYSKETGNGAVY